MLTKTNTIAIVTEIPGTASALVARSTVNAKLNVATNVASATLLGAVAQEGSHHARPVLPARQLQHDDRDAEDQAGESDHRGSDVDRRSARPQRPQRSRDAHPSRGQPRPTRGRPERQGSRPRRAQSKDSSERTLPRALCPSWTTRTMLCASLDYARRRDQVGAIGPRTRRRASAVDRANQRPGLERRITRVQ